MKNKRWILSAATSLSILGCAALNVQAAPKQMEDGTLFDAEYYAATNPDVTEILGADESILYQHYQIAGKNEGRLPYEGYQSPESQDNPSGRETASGNTINSLIDADYKLALFDRTVWNAETGAYDTIPGGYFDEVKYATQYPDITAVHGTDHEALWQHYSKVGIYEGRKAYVCDYLPGYRLSPRVSPYVVDQYQASARIPAYIEICDIAATICRKDMTSLEKIRTVHDWMLNNINYDYGSNAANYVDGAIYSHTSKCNGYSMTFDGFMAALGIECHYINGQAGNEFHSWNSVLVDGKWYDIDVTWDDCYYDPYKDTNPEYAESIRYNFFMLPHNTGEFASRTIQYED